MFVRLRARVRRPRPQLDLDLDDGVGRSSDTPVCVHEVTALAHTGSDITNTAGANRVEEQADVRDDVESAQKHIQEIRDGHGLGNARVPDDMVENLKQACLVMSDQLNATATHFLLELIQNADDNTYAAGVATLIFSFDGDYLQVECNEVGFKRDHVKAICSLGQSAKKGNVAYIGEKGIGFKSVFRVADAVWISSLNYSFMFQLGDDSRLGMIAPIWADFPASKRPGWTSFYLRLRSNSQSLRNDVQTALRGLDPNVITFLRSLGHIAVRVRDAYGIWQETNLRRAAGQWNGYETVRLQKNELTTTYVVRRRGLSGMPHDERRNQTTSEVIAAFPVDEDMPVIAPQQVFAYLPIDDFGFPFLLQADFIVTANREGVEDHCGWNESLSEGLTATVREAVTHFSETNTPLRYTWVRYIPKVPTSSTFFGTLKLRICDEIQRTKVLRAWNETLQRPNGMVFVPQRFRDESDAPVTLTTPKASVYLSGSYSAEDLIFLKRLGVKEMTENDFADDFRDLLRLEYAAFSTSKPAAWHRSLARVLNQLPDRLLRPLRRYMLVKLRTGEWVSANTGSIYFPGEGGWAIPGSANIRVVDSEVAADPARRQLCSRLGVTSLAFLTVQNIIVQLHASTSQPLQIPQADLIAQLYFLFSTGWTNRTDARLWVATGVDSGTRCRADEAYMEDDGRHAATRMLSDIREQFHFLNPAYDTCVTPPHSLERWRKWLEEEAGVARLPRLVAATAPGVICDDFLQIVAARPSAEWLELLCEEWDVYKQWLQVASPTIRGQARREDPPSREALRSQLSSIPVQCTSGADRPLGQTSLPLTDFTAVPHGDIPLLSLPDVEHTRWQHLECFGVIVKSNVKFFLLCLSELSGTHGNFGRVKLLLSHIQARCGPKDEALVRGYFQISTAPLIFVPHAERPHDQTGPTSNSFGAGDGGNDGDSNDERDGAEGEPLGDWYRLENCLWRGPRYLRVRVCLADVYPASQRLFSEVLRIPDTKFSDLRCEALEFSPDDSLQYIFQVLSTMGRFMHKGKVTGEEFHNLEYLAMWPVQFPGSPGVRLRTAAPGDEWFIADRNHWYGCFGGVVPILAFDVDTQFRLECLFAKLRLYERYITKLSRQILRPRGRVERSEHTDVFRSKYKFFARVIRALREDPDKEPRLARLREVEVYTAPAIHAEHWIRFGGRDLQGVGGPRDALVVEKPERFEIFMRSSYLERDCTHNQLLECLEHVLSYKPHRNTGFQYDLSLVVREHDEERIHALLESRGLPRNAQDDNDDDDWINGDGEGRGRRWRAARGPHEVPDHGGRFFVLTADTFGEFFTLFGQETNARPASEPSSESRSSVAPPLDLGSSGWSVKPDEELEFAGESEVAKELQRILGDDYRPTEHWTSPRRTRAGLAPFVSPKGVRGTAFQLQDTTGKFTDEVAAFGCGQARYWKRQPPTWHLEVKATNGGLGEEFFMDNVEFERARSFWAENGHETIPNKMLILGRVFGLSSGTPQIAWIVQPWEVYLQGRLEFQCEGVIRGRPALPQEQNACS